MPEIAFHFDPVWTKESEVLILGSFPSVKSRETGFFYGHPRNRFWKMLASVYGEPVPETVAEKKQIVLRHRLALSDVVASCDIVGSGDASIKNVMPMALSTLWENAPIRIVLCNGATSYRLFRKYFAQAAIKLPSTSPANALCGMDDLVAAWAPYLRGSGRGCVKRGAFG